MSFSGDLREEIIGLKMWDANIEQEEQLAKLYVREAFIKSGFMSDPQKEYHLEILCKEVENAQKLLTILNNFGIKAKMIKKANDNMIYIKDGEEISAFLALIGVANAVLKFEETRVIKEARNNINRLINCETANLNKTINSSIKQMEEIKLLKRKNMFTGLPESLKELAELRMKNPDSSYEELGKMLKKPISKSGVNHRLKKISQIAKELK